MNAREPMFIHYVYDMDRAVEFYRTVFSREPATESLGWMTFEIASIQLALHILHGDIEESPIPHAGLNFIVDSVDDACARIERAGGKVLMIREPDDFVPVRVVSCVDTERNGFELRQLPSID